MRPGSIDLVIADPPYGVTRLIWDRVAGGWMRALRPALASHASVWCFGSLNFFMRNRDEFDDWLICQEIVWEKHNGSGPVGAGLFNRVHELVVQFRPKDVLWRDITKANPVTFDATARKVPARGALPCRGQYQHVPYETIEGGPRRARSVIPVRSMHRQGTHPTEKPVALLEQLISASSLPGHLVLDPFGGSGSTAAATHNLGRHALLIEADAAYADGARARMAAAA